jgi:diguanylate cyclase (GGDEF)-like protein
VAGAEELRRRIDGLEIDGIGHVSVSMGVAVKMGQEPLEQFIARADKALYRAKERGRNRVVWLEDETH